MVGSSPASSKQVTGACDGAKPARRARALFLYLAVLIVGIAGAWAAHVLLVLPGRSVPQPGSLTGAGAYRPEVKLRAGSQPLGDMLENPLDQTGLAADAPDPADIPPPDGARLDLGREIHMGTVIIVEAAYDFPGDLAAAARHYARQTRRFGFEPLLDRSLPRWRRVLSFARSDGSLVVFLRKPNPGCKIVRVIVRFHRPAQ